MGLEPQENNQDIGGIALKSFISPLLAVVLCAGSAYAQEELVRLNADGKFLNQENGKLELGAPKKAPPSSLWERLSAGRGVFLFRNSQTGQYLVSSGNTVATTQKPPSPQGAGPHYWLYRQPFSNRPTANAITTQSGLFINQTATGLSLEKTASPLTVLVEDYKPRPDPVAPVTVEYQRLINTKKDPLSVDRGQPMFGRSDMASPGCMWEAKEMRGVAGGRGLFYTFINRKTGLALSSSGRSLTTEPLGPITTGKEPFVWRAIVNGERVELTNSQGALLPDILMQPVK